METRTDMPQPAGASRSNFGSLTLELTLLKTENSRWTVCRAALGREPRGGLFMRWITTRWEEFAAALGVDQRTASHRQEQFDRWLQSGGKLLSLEAGVLDSENIVYPAHWRVVQDEKIE